MLKVRYFRVKLELSISEFTNAIDRQRNVSTLRIVQSSMDDVVFTYAASRQIQIRRIMANGQEVVETVSTVDFYSLRLFQTKDHQYLSIIDPPRGARLITEILEQILGDAQFFVEPLELTPDLIKRHANRFDSARLVSAKVRDFEVYEGAIGRLEITSQNGLQPNIAPFLENKFHRIEALTYEVSQRYVQGLVYYYRNGTLKASGPLVEIAFPSFESCFE
jgi:hypothetical protein